MMANLSLYGKFHPRDLNDLREVLRSYDAPVRPEQCVDMPRGALARHHSRGGQAHHHNSQEEDHTRR